MFHAVIFCQLFLWLAAILHSRRLLRINSTCRCYPSKNNNNGCLHVKWENITQYSHFLGYCLPLIPLKAACTIFSHMCLFLPQAIHLLTTIYLLAVSLDEVSTWGYPFPIGLLKIAIAVVTIPVDLSYQHLLCKCLDASCGRLFPCTFVVTAYIYMRI